MCSKLYADGELAATPYETDKVLRHRELCMGLNVLYAKKNHDYGDSFHQTYIEEGMAMPRIRLGDKFSRFKTLSRILSSDSDQQAVTDESIRDTLPTAYEALRKIDEEDARFHRLLDTIFYLCELAGFRIEGRIVLTDKRTGRIWR